MKLSSSLKFIVGGAVVGYTKGNQKLNISSYDMIDGDQCFPDTAYPRENLQPVPVCPNINNGFAPDPNQYQPLSGGSGLLTDGEIATLKALGLGDTEGEKYVCWDFRNEFTLTDEFPIVLRFGEDVNVNAVYVSVDDANSSVRAPGKIRIGMEEYTFPSNPGNGAYTGINPLTTPVSVSAGDDFTITIIRTDVEGECTGIGFPTGGIICPTVCLSEVQAFGTISSDSTRSRSKASKSKASKGSKAKVRKLNYV